MDTLSRNTDKILQNQETECGNLHTKGSSRQIGETKER